MAWPKPVVALPLPYVLLFESPDWSYDSVGRTNTRTCLRCGHRETTPYGEAHGRVWHRCDPRGERVFVIWEGSY